MLFNSWEFLLFFPIVTILFFLIPKRLQWFHLLTASFLFYMAFLPVYVLILVITIIIDYIAGIQIEKVNGHRKKVYLVLSIIANIGFLCLFKYYDFFTQNINDFFSVHFPFLNNLWLGKLFVNWNNSVNALLNSRLGTSFSILTKIILPIGLSFHTFQALSYTIEVYRGNQKAERHFGIYALYVMFYPQLVAGPIERPQNMLHQFHKPKSFNADYLVNGLRLMVWGLFKKVVIADRASIYVDLIYSKPESFHWLNIGLAMLYFSIQIYCDFSGYSDMAIGAARCMGFDLMINFRRPYFATNIREFWGRWHISLSTWFKDYVYIPMGGSRLGFSRFLLATITVFLVSGFWHGAAWTFLIWGGLHAIFQIIFIFYTRYCKHRMPVLPSVMRNFLGWFLTMFAIVVAWVFFRAKDFKESIVILKRFFFLKSDMPFKWFNKSPLNGNQFGSISALILLFAVVILFVVETRFSERLFEISRKPAFNFAFFAILITLIFSLGMFTQESFIYFQF